MTYMDPEYTMQVGDEADQLYRRMAEAERRRERNDTIAYLAWWAFAGLFCVACWWGVAYVLGWL